MEDYPPRKIHPNAITWCDARDKLKKFHPDIVENLKLGPEYREMFEEKTRDIQKAYEKLGGK